jgi:hypothetical protein
MLNYEVFQNDINVSLVRADHRLLKADQLIEEARALIKIVESLLKDPTM